MTADLRALVLAACDVLESHRDELCRLDAVAGDGDHGVTMALGALAVRRVLEAQPDASGPALLRSVAGAAASVGGSSGPLWATMLLRAVSAPGLWPEDAEPTVSGLRACADAALAGVQAIGKAQPGDKTMVDALAPAAAALAAAEADGATPAAATQAAAVAARAGAQATADMVASVGRASRLGERSRGSPDPGATSVALVLEAIARAGTQ